MSYPERIDPDTTESGVLALHLKRYDFALPLCNGADVLDAACGAGYGAAHLAQRARSVLGVDVSEETIAEARRRYPRQNLVFRAGDVEQLADADASYDVVCSFETIEHVETPERALDEFARVLRPNGVLVASTPHVRVTTHRPANPHHRIELDRTDFERLLRERFRDVEILGQRRLQSSSHRFAQRVDVLGLRRRVPWLRRGARLLGTAPTESLTLEDIVISQERLELATELVVVCREPKR